MADIVLMDKNGSPVTYEGVTAVNTVTADNTSKIFHDLSKLKCYYFRATGTEGYYEIISSFSLYLSGENGVGGLFAPEMIEEYGYLGDDGVKRLGILFTSKTFEPGVYPSSQLYK